MIHQMTQDGLDVQEQAGFPFLQGQEPTLRALNALWFFAERAGRTPPALPPAPPSDLTPANLEATLARYGIAHAAKPRRRRAHRQRPTPRQPSDFRWR